MAELGVDLLLVAVVVIRMVVEIDDRVCADVQDGPLRYLCIFWEAEL